MCAGCGQAQAGLLSGSCDGGCDSDLLEGGRGRRRRAGAPRRPERPAALLPFSSAVRGRLFHPLESSPSEASLPAPSTPPRPSLLRLHRTVQLQRGAPVPLSSQREGPFPSGVWLCFRSCCFVSSLREESIAWVHSTTRFWSATDGLSDCGVVLACSLPSVMAGPSSKCTMPLES